MQLPEVIGELRRTTDSQAVVVLLFDKTGQLQLAADGLTQENVARALHAAMGAATDGLVAKNTPQA